MSQESTDAAHSKKHLSRRTHHKSRLGCAECKRRRIKCDEIRPACANCLRRAMTCSYISTGNVSPASTRGRSPMTSSTNTIATNTPTPSSDGTLAASVVATPQSSTTSASTAPTNAPDLFQLELWHNWLTTTSLSFSDSESSAALWTEKVPRCAFRHGHVAQLLLALSALHMSRSQSHRRAKFVSTATALQSSAIDGMISDMASAPDKDRTSSLFLAAMLLCFCNLAKGPQDGQYLLYANVAEPEWLGLLQGVKLILADNHHVLDGFDSSDDIPDRGTADDVGPGIALPGFEASFSKLMANIASLCAEDVTFEKYSGPVDDLQTCCASAFWRRNGSNVIEVRSHMVFAWLYRLDADYLEALQQGKPMALVIYAHYMVLFARLGHCWYVEGWATHIMKDIRQRLHTTYLHWLDWPHSLTQQLP